MKSIKDIQKDFEEFTKKRIQATIKAQEETAQKIWEDVIDIAQYKTGAYIDSIKVSPTTEKNGVIETFIGSDLNVKAKSTGKSYNLGYLLEHGTLEHAIPNAFNWGVIFGFESEQYLRTCQKDWHPGSHAFPHYKIALQKNKKLYKDKMKMTWR